MVRQGGDHDQCFRTEAGLMDMRPEFPHVEEFPHLLVGVHVHPRGAFGLKDNISREDATVVRRLKDAGAIVVTKARPPFMALWYESQNTFGCACNPYDVERTAGGSSGGEAALVAVGAVPFGVGQDGNGSIRVPSHGCGIAGLAPALGRVSIAGLYPPAENWERAFCHKFGPMARRVEDLALGLSVMAGEDPQPRGLWWKSVIGSDGVIWNSNEFDNRFRINP